MVKHAAAVLVLRGPRALGFSKYNLPGVSMPCGKVETGETPAMAAVREGLEETGLHLELLPDPPYVGFDTVGGSIVHTYRARVVGGELIDTAPGEGSPFWASIQALATGPYWHYNQRALRHFGIRPPLTGKFHSHITIEGLPLAEAERAATLVGGKLTVIGLSRGGRTQTDMMITHHYATNARGLEDQYDIVALLRARGLQLEQSGVTVTRLKLEYDLLHDRSDRGQVSSALDNIYTEVHVKCVVDSDVRDVLMSAASAVGWHPSRNPFAKSEGDQVVQFVNRRFYGLTTLADIDREVDKILPVVTTYAGLEEIKYETAVFDSNEKHDGWWMEVGQ